MWSDWLVFCDCGFQSVCLLMTEKAMAPHSSSLAWEIPWTEEPGRLQSMGSPRVGHDWATSLSLFTFMHWRRNPLQCSCLENPRDGGAWWEAMYGVAQSRTGLKRLSSSSSSSSSPLMRRIRSLWKLPDGGDWGGTGSCSDGQGPAQ